MILAGVRAFQPGECEYVERVGFRRYGVDGLEGALEGLTGPVYVHVELGVLDPMEFASACYPEPDGVPLQRLIDLVSRVDNVVGASITEHAPSQAISLQGMGIVAQ